MKRKCINHLNDQHTNTWFLKRFIKRALKKSKVTLMNKSGKRRCSVIAYIVWHTRIDLLHRLWFFVRKLNNLSHTRPDIIYAVCLAHVHSSMLHLNDILKVFIRIIHSWKAHQEMSLISKIIRVEIRGFMNADWLDPL